MFKTLNRFNTRAAKYDMVADEFTDQDYIVFSVADSDYQTAPEINAALHQRVNHGAFGYTKPDDVYMNAIIDWVKHRYHYTITDSMVLPSSKVLALLSYIVETFTDSKDKIMIQTPVYHVFYPLVNQHRRTLIENSLLNVNGVYSMDFKAIEDQFKLGVKMVVLCNPHNPVGRVWHYDELKNLVGLCKRYNVYLISDEIHADIIMDPHKFISVGHFIDDYDRIIIVNAPSKTFNIAGLHSAYAIVPSKKLYNKLKIVLLKYYALGQNALAIEALIAAYQKCAYWVDAQNQHIDENFKLLSEFMRKHYPKAVLSPLEGTYLAWIDFSKYSLSTKALLEKLKNYGLIFSEGPSFGKQCDGFIRMNLACSKEQLKEGLNRFKKALQLQ